MHEDGWNILKRTQDMELRRRMQDILEWACDYTTKTSTETGTCKLDTKMI